MNRNDAVSSHLYAFLLRLRPLHSGTVMPFSGELVHGAFLHWLKRVMPDGAAWLHDGSKRRLFTCSSLQFPLSERRMIEAERTNIHLRLDPENTYTIRITLLLGELFPLFYEALMHFMRVEQTSGTLPFIQIGKQVFTLDSIIAGPLEDSGWAGSISLANLVKEASMLRMGKVLSLNMEFTSLTTFNRSNKRSQIYGGHSALLPLPSYLFPGLARRWQEIAPPELASLVQIERIEQYIADDGIIISDYNLQPHQVHFTTHLQPGFVGKCTYDLRGPEEQGTEDAPLMLRQQIWLLARLASYCGVGYKTAMGLGQACLLWHKGACDL